MTARPFLKWVGGKTQLVQELRRRLPGDFTELALPRDGKYWEPFLGGGALFWSLDLRPGAPAEISDLNEELVAAYNGVRYHVEEVIEQLRTIYEPAHAKDPSDFYYHVRKIPWRHLNEYGVTARMIYLNKTGFNGLYRVNSKGEFNVPYGKRPLFAADADNLRACSRALQHVTITHGHYDIVTSASEGDVVYFDPPYVPLKADSFTSYTAAGFGLEDQVRLRDLALSMKRRGVFVMLSNSSAPLVHELYKDFTVEEVLARRNVNRDGDGRGKIKEVIIT